MTIAPPKPSDLGVRTLSGIAMVAVAGTALWLGGWVFSTFVLIVGLGVLWEWWGLASKSARSPLGAAVWLAAGASYVAIGMAMLVHLRGLGMWAAALPIFLVIAVDIGAYFAGRTIGGPKIAPSISPSKTWAGLCGGMILSAVVMMLAMRWMNGAGMPMLWLLVCGGGAAIIAVIAQAGDFFESWMKRRAGVKDSGSLIPGHGGLLDRVDGLLAVLFAMALLMPLFAPVRLEP